VRIFYISKPYLIIVYKYVRDLQKRSLKERHVKRIFKVRMMPPPLLHTECLAYKS